MKINMPQKNKTKKNKKNKGSGIFPASMYPSRTLHLSLHIFHFSKQLPCQILLKTFSIVISFRGKARFCKKPNLDCNRRKWELTDQVWVGVRQFFVRKVQIYFTNTNTSSPFRVSHFVFRLNISGTIKINLMIKHLENLNQESSSNQLVCCSMKIRKKRIVRDH